MSAPVVHTDPETKKQYTLPKLPASEIIEMLDALHEQQRKRLLVNLDAATGC